MLHEIRLAARLLLKSPAFTLVTVLTLALGIGVNAAIFTVVRSILLRDVPYAQPREIVSLSLVDPTGASQNYGVTGPEVGELRKSLRSLKAAAG